MITVYKKRIFPDGTHTLFPSHFLLPEEQAKDFMKKLADDTIVVQENEKLIWIKEPSKMTRSQRRNKKERF